MIHLKIDLGLSSIFGFYKKLTDNIIIQRLDINIVLGILI